MICVKRTSASSGAVDEFVNFFIASSLAFLMVTFLFRRGTLLSANRVRGRLRPLSAALLLRTR